MDRRPAISGNSWSVTARRFDHMLVLDADSVMSGAAIVRLVRIMEGHPEIGILQQLIVGLPNVGPFPRIFQFGMRHGMRAYTVGSAWWQGDCGPYWGHNALIRIAPFMAHCRLPVLPGGPPLGGRLLSHDQVEAVLMRRAGWQVRVLPEEARQLRGEPAHPLGFRQARSALVPGQLAVSSLGRAARLALAGAAAARARHLDVRVGPGLDAVLARGLRPRRWRRRCLARRLRANRRSSGRRMPWEPWALLAATMTLVFAPKLAGVAQVLLVPRLRRDYGGGGARRALGPGRARCSPSSSPRSWRWRRAFSCSACWRAARSAGKRSGATRASLGWARHAWFVAADPAGPGPGRVGLEPRARVGATLGRPVLRAAAARRPVRRGHLMDPAGPLARAPGHLRRARGGHAAAGGRCLRACRRTAGACRSRWAGPPALLQVPAAPPVD